MRKVVLGMAAAVAVCLAAGSASAQTGAPGCAAALDISAAGRQVSCDRYIPVTVRRGDPRQARDVRAVRVEVRDSANAERLYADDLTATEIRALIDGDPDGPVTYLILGEG